MIKDSGSRKNFETGARRDIVDGKGRFDLLPFDAVLQVARIYEEGAKKYADRNWELGIPVQSFLNSAVRHLLKAVAGITDEPHLPMAAWNILCAIQTHIWIQQGRLPASLMYDKEVSLFVVADKPTEDTSHGVPAPEGMIDYETLPTGNGGITTHYEPEESISEKPIDGIRVQEWIWDGLGWTARTTQGIVEDSSTSVGSSGREQPPEQPGNRGEVRLRPPGYPDT